MAKKLTKILFLDDRSKRIHSAFRKYSAEKGFDLTVCFTAKECIKMLSNEGPWDVVSLDHDLCFEEFQPSFSPDCGMAVVRWIGENALFLDEEYSPNFIIHTSNKAAAFQMQQVLLSIIDNYGTHSQVYMERFEYE